MKLRKRIFSLLLMLCMVVTLMPTSYSATETESGTLIWNYNISFEDGSIANDADATIWLTDDISLGGEIVSEYVGGTGSYEFNYVGDKYVYNDKEYTYAYITYNMPTGYVFKDEKGNNGEDISGLGLVYSVAQMKALENGTVSFVAVPSDDNEDNLEGTTKDFYVKVIDATTKDVFTGVSYPMVQYYDSNNTYIVEGEIEKVGDGLFKVPVDTQTYSGCYLRVILPMSMEYCFVETQSPYVYATSGGGVYIPVSECFTNGDTITVEVESCEYLDYEKFVNFKNSDGNAFDDVKVTVKLSNGADDTQKVVYSELTGGTNAIRVRTYNGKFAYTFNHKAYSTIEITYELPEGYVVNGNASGTWCYTGEEFLNTLDLGEIVVEEKKVETGELTFTYKCVETLIGEFGNSEPGNVIPDATMTAYFSQALSDGAYDTENEVQFAIGGCEGSVTVSYVGDKFMYNGQEYDYVMFLGNFPNGYSEGTARTVADLKVDSDSTQYFMGPITSGKPEVSNTITINFNRGDVVKNLPYAGSPLDLDIETLEPMVYKVTVDEEDVIYENGNFYLVSSLNELFPEGIPEAPDHEIAGDFLGWQGEYEARYATTLEEYCLQPHEEFKLYMENNTEGLSIKFNAVYDKKVESYMVSYIDELGITKSKIYFTYADFPRTIGEQYENAKNVIAKNATELLGLKHVESYGKVTVSENIIPELSESKKNVLSPIVPYPYYGEIMVIQYNYEYNRTGENFQTTTTFDKTEYSFGLEDGTIVDGVEVTVSLCNGINDAEKVTIETSTSGQGDFVIEHIDDVIYYGGNTYDTIEFEYNFPEGYVIKDTDITGTTVWYTATNWCTGGGTFWILEKLPEEVVIPEQNVEVEIIIPDVDAPAEEEVKVEIPEEKPVVSEDKMDEIIEANKKHPVKIETNDDVTIEFPAGGMKPIEGKEEYDFGVKIEKDYEKAHDKDNNGGQHVDEQRKFKEDEFVLRINYNYSGELPGEAEISIPVGKEWAGKRLYYYQLMEDGSYRYTGQNAIVDEHGYFKVKQGHCSDYVVVTAAPESSLLYYLSSDNAGNTASYTSPKTGDNNMSVYLMMIASMGVAVIPVMKKRKAK